MVISIRECPEILSPSQVGSSPKVINRYGGREGGTWRFDRNFSIKFKIFVFGQILEKILYFSQIHTKRVFVEKLNIFIHILFCNQILNLFLVKIHS